MAAVLSVYLLTTVPSLDRSWDGQTAHQATVRWDGTRFEVQNHRAFRYSSVLEWDTVWQKAHFELADAETAWFVVEPFKEFSPAAHTMVTFGFKDGRYLVISAEVRKEMGEDYGVLRGLYRSFEIVYVAGDERDLIELRAVHRKDDVCLYRIKAEPVQVQAYLKSMLDRMNDLADKPEFYNTLSNNCTTSLADHLEAMGGDAVPRWDYRLLLPGFSGELARDMGLLDTNLDWEGTQKAALVNDRALKWADKPEFSRQIRSAP